MKNTVKQKEDYIYKMSNHYYKQEKQVSIKMFIPFKKGDKLYLIEITYFYDKNEIELSNVSAFDWTSTKSGLKDQIFTCWKPYNPFFSVKKNKITRNVYKVIEKYFEEFIEDIDVKSYDSIRNVKDKINSLL